MNSPRMLQPAEKNRRIRRVFSLELCMARNNSAAPGAAREGNQRHASKAASQIFQSRSALSRYSSAVFEIDTDAVAFKILQNGVNDLLRLRIFRLKHDVLL